MKEYDIKITETIEKTVTVTAENLSEAQEKVRKSYSDSVYDFDPVTLVNTEFTVESEKTIDMDSLMKMDVLLVKPNMYPPTHPDWLRTGRFAECSRRRD